MKQEAKQETILAQEETRQETAQTQTTADTSTGFKHYEPGQLHYESDGITVSIEQKTKDGMTYFVRGRRFQERHLRGGQRHRRTI